MLLGHSMSIPGLPKQSNMVWVTYATFIHFITNMENRSRIKASVGLLFPKVSPWLADRHLLPDSSHGFPFVSVYVPVSSYKDISHKGLGLKGLRTRHPNICHLLYRLF